MTTETVLIPPYLTLQPEDHEEVEVIIRIKTDAPYARWAYLLDYELHFFEIFNYRRKE